MKQLRNLKWSLQWFNLTRSFYWTKALYKYGVPPIYSVRTKGRHDIIIANSEFVIPRKGSTTNLLKSFGDVNALALYGAKFHCNTPWDQIEIGGLFFNIYNEQSLHILAEVFISRIYEVALPDKPVVIDVGMNVGTSAVFFASTLKCSVYGYEPFEETFNKALANIKLNSDIFGRIHAFRCAVGSTKRKEEVLYCPDSPGDCGIVPIPEQYQKGRATRKETIEVKPITEIIESVLKADPHRDLILKLDCEGMEYEIINCLVKTRFISYIKIIMMEWHLRGNLGNPALVQSELEKSGFIIFGSTLQKEEVGMLYAVNRTTQLTII